LVLTGLRIYASAAGVAEDIKISVSPKLNILPFSSVLEGSILLH
jgi:hypothetical protein